MCHDVETEASRIRTLIESAQFAKALWVLRDSLARNSRNQALLALAGDLAAAAGSKAISLGASKATECSRETREIEAIARQAREYLDP
jgi:hypothetical protein